MRKLLTFILAKKPTLATFLAPKPPIHTSMDVEEVGGINGATETCFGTPVNENEY